MNSSANEGSHTEIPPALSVISDISVDGIVGEHGVLCEVNILQQVWIFNNCRIFWLSLCFFVFQSLKLEVADVNSQQAFKRQYIFISQVSVSTSIPLRNILKEEE